MSSLKLIDPVFGKIEAAIQKAQRNLIAQRAKNNDTVVLVVDGKPEHISAKQLIGQTQQSPKRKR